MMCVTLFAILSTVFLNVFSFNLDIRNAIVYEDFLSEAPERRSYFGYSTVLYSGSPSWILIGAPRANFSRYGNVTEPGVTVRCAIAGNCTTVLLDRNGNEEPELVGEQLPWDHKDKAWIGVSMDVEQDQNLGKAVVCGHRWKDQRVLRSSNKLYMPGVCYWMEAPYESANKYLPFTAANYTGVTNGVKEYIYGMAQGGISVHLAQKTNKQNGSTLLIGAPGAYTWEGTNVICEDGGGFSSGKQKREAQPNSFSKCFPIKRNTLLKGDKTFPYIGYSVSSGKFFDDELLFVSSAPRSDLKGAVIIFSYKSSASYLETIYTLRGETITEYFGASITVADINNDGHDELIIGAPFFSVTKDEGRIYVYTRSGTTNKKKTMRLYQIIHGEEPGSQFGLAVTSLGLLNQDEFKDIAVGAPYANNGHGMVYIYNGGKDSLKLTQRISAAQVYSGLRGFGISFSNAADIDSNGIKDVAIGSYLSGHTVLLRASPVIILTAEIYASTFVIQRTTTTFSVHPAIQCYGCESAHKFTIFLSLKVDLKYNQAFVDKELRSHEYNETLEFEGHATKTTYINIYITEDPDTEKDIELNLSIEMEQKPGNIIMIKKDKREGEDVFCKNCAVVDKAKSLLEDTETVKFANACGEDGRCDAYLVMNCSIKNPRYDGNNIYVVGSEGPILLEVLLENKEEPAYSVTLTIESEPLIGPAKIPKMCKQTLKLEIIECEIGNIYNDSKVQKSLTLEYDVMTVTEYALSNESASMLTFSVTVNTTSYNKNSRIECLPILELKREAKINISGSSKPDYLLLKGSNERMTHLYKAVKDGPTPLKEVQFFAHVPTHYTADHEKFVRFLIIKTAQFTQDGKDISCRYPDQKKDQTMISGTLQERHTQNAENKTLFLNCSSLNVICEKVSCNASEMRSKNSYFNVTIDLDFNASSLMSLVGIKSTLLFSTSAYAVISVPEGLPMSDRKSVSTVIVADKPHESLAAWIIIVAIIGGILLLCLLIFGMKKAGFFRRRKKELLMKATLEKEEEGQTTTE